jgi:hypothetical protein
MSTATGRTRDTVVVSGSLAQRPGHGGHAWVFLQYLLGFRRLGYDVLFLDRIDPDASRDAVGAPCPPRESVGYRFLADLMGRFGLAGDFAVSCDGGRDCLGLDRREVLRRVRRSALLLNVMGFCNDADVLAAAPRRVFLDIDPGFPQMWRELGLSDLFRGHDQFVTIGLNVGREGCEVPTCGLEWVTTPQPIVLEHWPVREPKPAGPVTSVCTWRGDWGGVEYRGKVYGLRVHEFRKFVSLPRRSGRAFELAVDIHPAETKDVALLDDNGWKRVEPLAAAGDPCSYQQYIARSAAEFMVAKNMYVDTRGGWFSDRSICYLASGRPVLAQETGIRDLFPTGSGLLTFSTPDEAAAEVEEVFGDYARHAHAARAVAEECFDSDKVLRRLLDKLGVN